MRPIAILETSRISKSWEFVTEFTLVENPVKGIFRDITREEASRIVEEYGLTRYPVKVGGDEYGERLLGAVWDSPTLAFQRRFSPIYQGPRILRHFRIRLNDNPRKADIVKWLRGIIRPYRSFLHRRIDGMFND